uniref:Uncharacterized protein n=1 Tax=Knipowitschia caucasica TaxID=637954 RepID=A0AAV2JNU3_KNICA
MGNLELRINQQLSSQPEPRAEQAKQLTLTNLSTGKCGRRGKGWEGGGGGGDARTSSERQPGLRRREGAVVSWGTAACRARLKARTVPQDAHTDPTVTGRKWNLFKRQLLPPLGPPPMPPPSLPSDTGRPAETASTFGAGARSVTGAGPVGLGPQAWDWELTAGAKGKEARKEEPLNDWKQKHEPRLAGLLTCSSRADQTVCLRPSCDIWTQHQKWFGFSSLVCWKLKFEPHLQIPLWVLIGLTQVLSEIISVIG